MQLKIKRTQKTSGLVSKSVLFCLDARLDLTLEEADSVKKYKLGDLVIYNSEDSKKHLANTQDGLSRGGMGGFLKASVSLAMAKLSLNLTLNKLVTGTHIECKDMNELLAAEEAIGQACQNARVFIETAETFDGREIVIDVAEVD